MMSKTLWSSVDKSTASGMSSSIVASSCSVGRIEDICCVSALSCSVSDAICVSISGTNESSIPFFSSSRSLICSSMSIFWLSNSDEFTATSGSMFLGILDEVLLNMLTLVRNSLPCSSVSLPASIKSATACDASSGFSEAFLMALDLA